MRGGRQEAGRRGGRRSVRSVGMTEKDWYDCGVEEEKEDADAQKALPAASDCLMGMREDIEAGE